MTKLPKTEAFRLIFLPWQSGCRLYWQIQSASRISRRRHRSGPSRKRTIAACWGSGGSGWRRSGWPQALLISIASALRPELHRLPPPSCTSSRNFFWQGQGTCRLTEADLLQDFFEGDSSISEAQPAQELGRRWHRPMRSRNASDDFARWRPRLLSRPGSNAPDVNRIKSFPEASDVTQRYFANTRTRPPAMSSLRSIGCLVSSFSK